MEQLLHYVWKHKLLPLKILQTTDGKTVEIIDSGLPNTDGGPDFFNAKIKIDGVMWVGNIELHERASDWFRHKHHQNKAYDSVILHIASVIDAEPLRSDGTIIPQMEMHCPPGMAENYEKLLKADRYPDCYLLIPNLPKPMLHSWLSALQIERIEQKTQQIERRLADAGGDWEGAFFVTLARNFGFGINSDKFEIWAKTIPLNAIGKHRDNLFQIEAIFFGQSGLLDVVPADSYTEGLIKEYGYLRHKFGLQPSDTCHWQFLRMHPNNFPHVRMAQLACLCHRTQGLLSQVLEAKTVAQIRLLLRGGTSEYWLTHYRFNELSPSRPKTLSNSSIDLIIINTIVPFLYAYGKHKSDEKFLLQAEMLLEELKPENNRIINNWRECGLTAAHAGDSQALIQLKQNYCDKRKCLVCRIGYEFLKSKVGG